VSETFQFMGVVYTKFVEEMKHIIYFNIICIRLRVSEIIEKE
jgi:hypothetical protein